MLQTKFVADSSPCAAHTHHRFGELLITVARFKPGMWQELLFPEAPGGYATIDSSHIQTRGTMIDPAGVLDPREPGWISSLDTQPIPAGVHRRMAITDVEIWCARPRDGQSSVWHVDEMKLEAGTEFQLRAGSQMLMLTGSVTSVTSGRTFNDVTHLVAKSDDQWFNVVEGALAFVWTPPTRT